MQVTDLKQCRKIDLQNLAEELGVEIGKNDRIPVIIQKIETADDYDRDFALTQAGYIIKDREDKIAADKEREKEDKEREKADKEREYEEKQREYEREKAEKQREYEREKEEREREEKQKEREFTLEQLRLTQDANRRSSITSGGSERPPKLPLRTIMHRFDPERSDITLFLNLFERQATKAEIETGDLVTHLLALVPVEIAELILREPQDQTDNFEYVKKFLLERFRMSPEAYRQKLMKHPRNPDVPWKDIIFELNSYLEGWLNGLGVTDFNSLKNLLITDQIKLRASSEMKEHFIDSWANYKDPVMLAKCLDEYEAVKGISDKKENARSFYDRKSAETKLEANSGEEKNSDKIINWRDKESKDRERIFERKRRCHTCGSEFHLMARCPKRQRDSTEVKSFESINHLGDISEDKSLFQPFLSENNCKYSEYRSLCFLRKPLTEIVFFL